MTHYICTGECGGVSNQPGNCQAEACSLHNEPLVECQCENNMHEGVKHTPTQKNEGNKE